MEIRIKTDPNKEKSLVRPILYCVTMVTFCVVLLSLLKLFQVLDF